MRTRVKICGITQIPCLRQAVALGVDALGFNMYPKSPRYVDSDTAASLIAEVPGFVTTVALFVNEAEAVIAKKLETLNVDLLQFHGDESNEFCRQFTKPFIKVLRIQSVEDIKRVDEYPDARGFLFDAHVEGVYGGTGQRIDPALLRQLPAGAILAGGLNPDNVESAISQLKPFAVDVSSGVEISTGTKDPGLLEKFFQAVRAADGREL